LFLRLWVLGVVVWFLLLVGCLPSRVVALVLVCWWLFSEVVVCWLFPGLPFLVLVFVSLRLVESMFRNLRYAEFDSSWFGWFVLRFLYRFCILFSSFLLLVFICSFLVFPFCVCWFSFLCFPWCVGFRFVAFWFVFVSVGFLLD
jgi:hypothetical protein